MHFMILITFDSDEAQTSREAREHAFETLLEDTSFVGGGRFGTAVCDWFVIGGRWSGQLSRATWAKDVQAQIEALQEKEGLRVWGAYYGDPEIQERQKALTRKVEKLYEEAIPGDYRDKDLCYARSTSVDHGYEDDAMLVDETLYERFLATYEGLDLAWARHGLEFADLDFDAASRDFIGQKWLVVVDAHL